MKKMIVMMFLLAGMIQSVNGQNWYIPERSGSISQTASLTISNRSEYRLTVKVMRTSGGLYRMVYVAPKSSACVTFPSSGNFYTKTKAEKEWDGILYRKGDVFHIQNDSEGYSEASLTFYVSSNGGCSGKGISRAEFERDY